ncbi:MAG: alpha/beta hydrolase [Lachnospiraceae bacterium]|nr:alpha/beta hydrolase [Lachnospiraceae bacterium]
MIIVKRIRIPELPTARGRRLYVYLPKGYEASDERYPVLYMFDGHNVFYDSHATYGKSWGMKEYLEKSRRKLILVGIECNPEDGNRMCEYSPWGLQLGKKYFFEGRGQITMDWITRVLKPEIDAEYRTLPDRAHTLIAGSSMGGLMAVYAAVAYNGVFSGAAALSPCLYFHPQKIADLIKKTPLASPTRVYMDFGSAETEEKAEPWAQMFRTAARLSKAGAHVAARVVPGALHNEAYWEKRIPVFMDYLLDR